MDNFEIERRSERTGRWIISIGIGLLLVCLVAFFVHSYREINALGRQDKFPRSVSTAN